MTTPSTPLCPHMDIITYTSIAGEPAGLWACADCKTKFVPITDLMKVEAQRDELLAAIAPFAALLQEHNSTGPDDQPIFGINSATITRGDLRRARAAIERRKP